MKKLIPPVIVAVAMMFGATGFARASEQSDRECSVATLRGLYAWAGSGYNIVAGVAQPKAVVELIDFDGDGTLTVTAGTVSINGVITHSPPDEPGTYSIAPDCSGTLAFGPPGPTFDLFLAPKGGEGFFVQNNSGSVLQGKLVRVSR